ncbi:MAG: hypothetical protein J0M02_10645, partial [Planctomycetes bacterium]|nr:hypothetical protein [Planctomycetota bacterium]
MRTRALSMLAAFALVALLLHVAAAAGGSGDRAGQDASSAPTVQAEQVEAPASRGSGPPSFRAERVPRPSGQAAPGDAERFLPPGAR